MNKTLLLFFLFLSCPLWADPARSAPTPPLLLPIQDPSNGKWGYMDEQGHLLIPAKYEMAYSFSEGLADVGLEDIYRLCKHGFIDTRGTIVIPCIYSCVIDFKHGQSLVELGDRWGILDKTGKYVIYPQYRNLSGFSEGLVMAASQTLRGYLNEQGKYQIPEQFEDARDFSGGLAAVSKGGLYGYIDHRGKTVIGFNFSDANNFSEGLAAAANEDEKWGYINCRGKWMIPPRFDEAFAFEGGMAEVVQGKKYFFIDKGGKPLLPGAYEDLYNYEEGLAAAKVQGHWGFIDRKGQWVIEPKYKEVDSFTAGWASVTDDSNETFYLSPTGKTLSYTPAFTWDGGTTVYLLILLLPAFLSRLICRQRKKELVGMPREEATQTYYRLGLNLNWYYMAYVFWFFAGPGLTGETNNYQILCGALWKAFHGLAKTPKIQASLYQMIWSFLIALLFVLGTVLTRTAVFKIDQALRGTTWTFSYYLKMIMVFQLFIISPMILWFGISPFLEVGSLIYYLALALFLVFIYALSPFFLRALYRARPLENPALQEGVERLLKKAGIKVGAVLLMGTRSSKTANAMVSGLFPFFRYIFFTDYLIEKFTPGEVEAVLAHEIGHIKKWHQWFYVVLVFAWALATKPMVEAVYPFLQSTGISIVFFFLAWFYLFYGILYKFFSRIFERQADVYCVKLTEKKETFISALNKLAELNFSTRRWTPLDRILKTHPDFEARVKRLQEMP